MDYALVDRYEQFSDERIEWEINESECALASTTDTIEIAAHRRCMNALLEVARNRGLR